MLWGHWTLTFTIFVAITIITATVAKQYQTHSIDTIMLLTIYQKYICDDENEHSFYALAMHSWFVHRQESWCKDSPGWLNLPKVGWTTTLPDLSKVGWTSTRSFQGWLNYASWLNYYPLFGAELDNGVLSMWCPLPSLTILTIYSRPLHPQCIYSMLTTYLDSAALEGEAWLARLCMI